MRYLQSLRPVMLTIVCMASVTLSQPITTHAQPTDPYVTELTRHITLNVEYPEKAKAFDMEGDAILRIRVDAEGNILRYAFVRKPGSITLEAAIHAAMRAASPVPAPPPGYISSNIGYADFMFPIAFRLEPNMENLVPIDRLFQQKVEEVKR